MKQEAINTFGDGLIMDLNPLTTPNTVLTSALNATLITYNGNEFVLQNDMGNGRVETAYLPAGYVPVGIKEYGGIIYVASYNPITNKGQIGSFPSPERNISSNEISQATEPVLHSELFGDLTSPGSQFAYKIKLFPDDVIIRSGDKFSILLKSQSDLTILQKFISNCLNVTNDKVTSPKNKLLTLSIAVLDSNNNFRDITDKLRRFDNDNDEIEFSITESPIIKFNSGFFTQTFDGTPEDVDAYREQRAVNTYNNKVFGELFLIATLNTITSVDVSVEGYVNKNGVSTVAEELPALDPGTTLIFTLDYKYNCPDGVYDSEYPERYATASEEFKNTYHSYHGVDDEFEPKQVINGALLSTNGVDLSTYAIPFQIDKDNIDSHPLFDMSSKMYTKRQSAYLKLKVIEGLLNYSVIPCMTYAPLTGLTTNGTINISKLGTGEVNISNWRYYCNPTSITLTWGLEAYPLTGTWIENVIIEFYDILNNTTAPIKTIIPSRKRSYNGVFTETIPFDNTLIRGNLYLARVTCTIGKSSSSEVETRLLGYRWMLATNLYNNRYFNADGVSINDFHMFTDEQLEESNTVKLVIATTGIQKVKKGAVSSSGSLWGNGTLIEDLSKINANNININNSLASDEFIENAGNYPFLLDTSKLDVTYTIMNDEEQSSRLVVNDVPFEGNSTLDNVVGDSIDISPVDTISDAIWDEHQFSIKLDESGTVVEIDARMLSQIVGPSEPKDVSITQLYKPFVSKDNFWEVFGFDYLDGFNSSQGAYARVFYNMAVDSEGRSGHRDWHRVHLFKAYRSGHSDGNGYDNIWWWEDDHDGNTDSYLSNWWDTFSQLIKDHNGAFPCAVLQGATMYSGSNHFDAYRMTGHYFNNYVQLWKLGSRWTELTSKYQILLWHTGSGYIPVNIYYQYPVKDFCVEMPQVVLNTFGDLYIKSSSSGSARVSTISTTRSLYNLDYKGTITYAVHTAVVGDNSMLTYSGSDYNEMVKDKIFSIIQGDSLVSDKTSTANDLLRLATFNAPTISSKITNFTSSLSVTGAQYEYVNLTSFIANGIESALVYNNTIYERDSDDLPFVGSNIYYVREENGTTYVNEVSRTNKAYLASNLKVGILGGRTTLLAKGPTNTIHGEYGMHCGNGDSSTTFHWGGAPCVEIQLDTPVNATPKRLSEVPS